MLRRDRPDKDDRNQPSDRRQDEDDPRHPTDAAIAIGVGHAQSIPATAVIGAMIGPSLRGVNPVNAQS